MTERTRHKTTGKRKAKARQMRRALDVPILAALQRPASSDRAMLARLEAGFEALVAEMQSSTARAGTDRAFRATPGTIATAAVRAARTKRGGK